MLAAQIPIVHGTDLDKWILCDVWCDICNMSRMSHSEGWVVDSTYCVKLRRMAWYSQWVALYVRVEGGMQIEDICVTHNKR